MQQRTRHRPKLSLITALAAFLLIAAGPDDAHSLARVFLDKVGASEMMEALITGTRKAVIAKMQQMGQTEAVATDFADTSLLPALKAHRPELMQKFEDLLVDDFTPAELRAILNNEQNEARQSAAKKAPMLQQQFAKAGQEWGSAIGAQAGAAYFANKPSPRSDGAAK